MIVCFDNSVKVRAVNSDDDPHNHVLRSFSEASIKEEEIGPFEVSSSPQTVCYSHEVTINAHHVPIANFVCDLHFDFTKSKTHQYWNRDYTA